MYKKVML